MGSQVRYRTVLRNLEFRALFGAFSLSLAGDQLARIALALLVYRRTGSSFEASATYGVSFAVYLVGGPVLAGLADRYPRLAVMVTCDVLRVPLVLLMALPDVPTAAVFVLIAVLGAVGPVFDSARSAIQPDLLPGDQYVVSNALMGITAQLSMVVGFVLGGAIVALAGVRQALVLDAATFLCSAGLLLGNVRNRPATYHPDGKRLGGMFDGLRLVARRDDLRAIISLAVLGSVAVTSTEGLAVPVARDLGGNAAVAGLLTAASPAGFLLASSWVVRKDAESRNRLLPLLVIISGVPLLATPFTRSVGIVLILWVVAGIGGAVNLIAAPAFMARVPTDLRARAIGVASTSLQVGQGLGLFAAGLLADALTARQATALVAALTLAAAIPALRAQGTRDLVRNAI